MKTSMVELVRLIFLLGVIVSQENKFTVTCKPESIKSQAEEEYTAAEVRPFDFCDIECNGTKHTMCQFEAGGGPKCELYNLKMYLANDEKKYIEDHFNTWRDQVATGKLGLPKASNMMKLVWDGELATIARRWADQCDQPLHDECRLTSDEVENGQAVYTGTFEKGSYDMRSEFKLARIKKYMEAWRAEGRLFDNNMLKSFSADSVNTTGNITQIIWGTTEFVGCGYTEFDRKDYVFSRFVCNFKNKGNIPYSKIYREGAPCSGCPKGAVCSDTYKGLCWNKQRSQYREIEDDGGGNHLESSVLPLIIVCTITLLYCR